MLLKGIGILFRSSSMDRILFDRVGLSWVFWTLVPLILMLLLASLVYLWSDSKIGYRMAQAAVLLHMLEGLLGGIIGIKNTAVLREAIIASREGRGLPVRQELLDLAGHPAMQVFVVAFPIIFSATILALLFFFERARKKAAEEQAAA
jgi:hypothetical protein